jgi:succinate dehydrogenase / fumarate reductase, membrane anchor subunit
MRTRESTFWTWHLLAGLVILVVLGIHMFVMHLSKLLGTDVGKGVLDYYSVMWRSTNVSFAVMYVVLLGAALYHGLYGLRTILFELTLSERAEKVVSALIVFVGILLFIVGSYGTIAVYLRRTV